MFGNIRLHLIALLATAAVAGEARSQDTVLAELYGRGVHAYFAGKSSEAQQNLTTAIEQGSQDPRAYYFRGLSYYRQGQRDAALDDFRTGAILEAEGTAVNYPISKSLQRVQGSVRLTLEEERRMARLEVKQKANAATRARFDAIDGARPRVERTEEPEADSGELPPPRSADPTDPFGGADTGTEPPAEPMPTPPATSPAEPMDGADSPFGTPPPAEPADNGANPFGTPPAEPAPDDDNPFGAPPPAEPAPDNDNPSGAEPPAEPAPENDNPFGAAPPAEPVPDNGNPFGAEPPAEPAPDDGNPFGGVPPAEPSPDDGNPFGGVPPAEPEEAAPPAGNGNNAGADNGEGGGLFGSLLRAVGKAIPDSGDPGAAGGDAANEGAPAPPDNQGNPFGDDPIQPPPAGENGAPPANPFGGEPPADDGAAPANPFGGEPPAEDGAVPPAADDANPFGF